MAETAYAEVGGIMPLGWTITDASGNPTNPGTATLTITLPDQMTINPTVTLPPTETGKPTVDYVTSQEGLHKSVLATTSPVTSFTEWFNAYRFASIISISEARKHLDIVSTVDNAELRFFMTVVAYAVESKVGQCATRSRTEQVHFGRESLMLNHRPVTSVTSVTSIRYPSTTWVTADLLVDNAAGVVSLLSGGWFSNGPWNVIYTAGRAVQNPMHIHAAKEMLRHLWESQRGRGADTFRPSLGEELVTTPIGTYSFPYKVMEMLVAEIVPGFA